MDDQIRDMARLFGILSAFKSLSSYWWVTDYLFTQALIRPMVVSNATIGFAFLLLAGFFKPKQFRFTGSIAIGSARLSCLTRRGPGNPRSQAKRAYLDQDVISLRSITSS